MEDGIRNALSLLASALSDASRALLMITGQKTEDKVIEIQAVACEEKKEPEPEVRKITRTELRTYMSELAGRGKKDIVQKVLRDYGVAKLSDVKEEDYQDLMGRLEYFSGDLNMEAD